MDEADVWKKIEELNRMYEDAVRAERVRYDTLLQQQTEGFSKADFPDFQREVRDEYGRKL